MHLKKQTLQPRLVWLTLLCACLIVPFSVAPAQSPITVEVDATNVTTDDEISLTISISGSNVSNPVFPNFEGFQVVATSRRSSTVIQNNQASVQSIYFYRLKPVETGELTIGEITATVDGAAVTSTPVTIFVEQGSQPVAPTTTTIIPPTELDGQDFYVDAQVDNQEPFLGEQILYIFRFYQAVELLGRSSYSAPEFQGFWNQQETTQAQQLTEVNGTRYRVTEVTTPLFPTIPGDRTIGVAELTLPNRVTLQTAAVPVRVKQHPQPAPDGFRGATGQFELSAEYDADQVAVGDPVMLRVTINGAGNFDLLPEPDWAEIDGWRQFENQLSVNSSFSGGQIRGERTYERLLIPSQPGSFTLPPIEYTYFDPVLEQYVTALSDPWSVQVFGDQDAIAAANESSAEQNAQNIANSDIANIKPVPRSLSVGKTPLVERSWYWVLWLLPLLVVVGDGVWRWLSQRETVENPARRKSQAAKLASEKLGTIGQSKEGAGQVEQIVNDYFSDRFGLQMVGLTQTTRSDKLTGLGISAETITLTQHLYKSIEEARFGMVDPDTNLGGMAQRLIKAVEQEAKS